MTCRIAVLRGWERLHLGDLHLYAQLPRYGYGVELVCSTRSRITEEEARMPIRRLRTPAVVGRVARTVAGGYLLGLVSPYRYYHEYLRGFSRAVRDVDVLCTHDPMHPTTYQAILEQRRGKKVVVQYCENIPYNWPHNRPLREHYETVFDRADHWIAISRDAERSLRDQGVPRERVSQLDVGIDLEFWRPPPTERPPREALRVLFVGQLLWTKGVQTVFEAMELADVPLELTIVGVGPEGPRLRWLLEQRRKRAGSRLASRVKFVDRLPLAELLRLRQESDIQVVPSIPKPTWREQLNWALLEGLACGLPAIASATGAMPEIVRDNQEGILVPPDYPQALAGALARLAREPETRRRMSLQARARMEERFELTRQARVLEEIFRTKVQAP